MGGGANLRDNLNIRNVYDFLDNSAKTFPNKIVFTHNDLKITYYDFYLLVNALASEFIRLGIKKEPILVILPKSIETLVVFFAAARSGNFYSILDDKTPIDRIKLVCENLKPKVIVTVKNNSLSQLNIRNIFVEDFYKFKIDFQSNENRYSGLIDTDLAYVLFTSGSTGIPKGVAITHKSIIDYVFWVVNTFNVNSNDILANQAPFYFDNSILDIYSTVFTGASLHIISNSDFAFPMKVLKYLQDNNISMIFWVPSVLIYFANTKAIENIKLPDLKKILFCGEIMPNKHLNIWRKNLSHAVYANLYGPTEITDVCAYYIIDREFEDDEILPIGIACENTELLVFDDELNLITQDQVGIKGELYVRGTCLSVGYYNDTKKTDEAFIQNPLHNIYSEKIYKTGDIVSYNQNGELLCFGRIDSQIKLKGHRIELGEIESVVLGIKGVKRAACIFDGKLIVCYYEADCEIDLKVQLSKKLPAYMIPSNFILIDSFKLNANSKIDRAYLKAKLIE